MDKLNSFIKDFNILLQDKMKILNMPRSKMNNMQRDVYFSNLELKDETTFESLFISEKELKLHEWSSSGFNYGATCRSVLTILRTLQRIQEIRSGGVTKFLILK
jgi:hypothetical protein